MNKQWRYERAQELLDAEGRTRRWLADKCTVQPTSMKLYMSGHRRPGPAVIRLMAMALGCDETYLTGASDQVHGNRLRA